MAVRENTTRRAVSAVPHDDETAARRWFDLIGEVYRELTTGLASPDELSWEDFRKEFDARARSEFGAEALERLWDFLEDNTAQRAPMQVIADLADPSALDDILDLYRRSTARPSPWSRVVDRYRDWSGWDGSEQGWVQFRDWLYRGANDDDPTWYAAAHEHLDPLNSMPLAQRISRMKEFGFTVHATADPAPADHEGADSAWDQVVRRYGSGWKDWDGSEEGWVRFRDWTYTAANGDDPSWYAAAYERLNPLNSLAAPARVARLKELGFTVTAAEPAAADVDAALDGSVGDALAATVESLVDNLAEVASALGVSTEELAALLNDDPEIITEAVLEAADEA